MTDISLEADPAIDSPLVRMALVILVVWGGIVWAFMPDVGAAMAMWRSNDAYSYCPLVPLVSLFILISRRRALQRLDLSPSWVGATLTLVSLAAWVLGQAAAITEIREFAVIGLLNSSLIWLAGWRFYRGCLFPMLYLFLMVPTATMLLAPLQTLTATLSGSLLRLAGIAALIDHHLITVPHGRYLVAPGCAGLNFLLTGVALSSLFALLTFRRLSQRILCVAVAILLSIGANAVRVFGIIWLAEVTDRHIDIVDDHLVYGWVLYGLAMMAAMAVGLRLRDPAMADPPPVGGGPAAHTSWLPLLIAGAAVIVIASTVQAAFAGPASAVFAAGRLALVPPMTVGAWRATAATRVLPALDALDADAALGVSYRGIGQPVELLIAYYWRQREGHKIGDLSAAIAHDGRWLENGQASGTMRLGTALVPIRIIRLSQGAHHRLIWSFDWIGGRHTASALTARLFGMAPLIGGDGRAAVIVLSANDDDGAGSGLLAEFCRNFQPIDQALAGATLNFD